MTKDEALNKAELLELQAQRLKRKPVQMNMKLNEAAKLRKLAESL